VQLVDATHLDYIRTFLGKVHTTATVKHYVEQRKIGEGDIIDTSSMLVYPGELVNVHSNTILLRYKVTLFEQSEALMIAAINDIITGCWKLNTRQAITSYTRPAAFIHAEVALSNKPFVTKLNYFWCDISLDCKFTTS
jgi:hypothetical protein